MAAGPSDGAKPDATEETRTKPFASFEHHFLLAMPGQAGTYFGDTLIYLCRHNAEGAFGLIINRTLELPFDTLLEQLHIRPVVPVDHQVHAGGPVRDEQGLVLHENNHTFPDSDEIGNGLCLTLSADILNAIGQGSGPTRLLFALGYSGWGAGQLEAELAGEAWIPLHASSDLLFDIPAEERLDLAARRNGIRLDRLSGRVGYC